MAWDSHWEPECSRPIVRIVVLYCWVLGNMGFVQDHIMDITIFTKDKVLYNQPGISLLVLIIRIEITQNKISSFY